MTTRTLRRRSSLALALGVCALSLNPHAAHAIWPPAADATQEQLAQRENQPNDPGYQGQWDQWSFIPGTTLMVPGFRTAEIPIGAGNNFDRAWGLTIGDPRVMIGVLDSGINWDNTDLINKVALNTRELPMPMGATAHDANNDGVVNVQDYVRDPRITCGTGDVMARNPRMCRDAMGQNNDPNRNGIIDAGDLIRVFSDSRDDDDNGYTDDIAGWDFFQDDNDPADATRFGHGTGEMRWSAAETNNNEGDAGDCPRCMVIPLRVADSFIGEVNDFAQAVVYSVDRGAKVVQEALGTIDNSTYTRQAIDYAYRSGVPVVASAADENSRHHNVPGTNNHTIYVHAIRYDAETIQRATTFLNFNNCTNYGGQLHLSVAGTGCSSEATGHTAGAAALMQSYALQQNLMPALSAEEIYQLLNVSADDINIPESQPSHPNYDDTKYPSLPGWDQRFGYGRLNARRALDRIREGRIPPEVDIVSPRWFSVHNPLRAEQRTLRLEGRIAARRAPNYDFVIEWARGIEPADSAWQMVRTMNGVTAPVDGTLGEIDLSGVTINNPGEVENRYTITVRVRVVAHYGGAAGDVRGEQRRVFSVNRDETVLPGFPIDVRGSGEASPHLVDLNGDGTREIIYGTADGELHAVRGNGMELPGFPVRLPPMWGMSPTHRTSYTRSAAYRGPNPAIDPAAVREPIIATPAIGNLDADPNPEIVVAGYHGTVFVFNHDGSAYGNGFPFELPDVPSSATSPNIIQQRGIFGSPVLYDLDNDRRPEIIFGAMDGKVYALDAATGMVKSGFPVTLTFPEPNAERNRIFGSVGVGNLDGQGPPDIVVVSSARAPGDNNTGSLYILHGDGNNHAGGAVHPNYPLVFASFNFFPLVGEGMSAAPPLADVNGDGRDEYVPTGNAIPIMPVLQGPQPRAPRRPMMADLDSIATIRAGARGPNSNYSSSIVSFAPVFGYATFGDINGDGAPDLVTTGSELALAISLAGGGRRRDFVHLVGAWSGRTGQVLPGFPQVIEDYTFFHNTAIASVDGDPYPEVIVATAGYYVHAFNACGREALGWPKFSGQWMVPSPALGDIDGDHQLDLAIGTRDGFLWAWRAGTSDDRTANIQWEGFRHDSANTGNLSTPLTQGVRGVGDAGAIVCPPPDDGDSGTVADASADASTDAGTAPRDVTTADAGPVPSTTGGGCGCAVPTQTRSSQGALALLGLALTVTATRRRRAR
jgi:hypothetical protein